MLDHTKPYVEKIH